MRTVHLFPTGQVERGTGRGGYRWGPGYTEVTLGGCIVPPLRRYEWWALGKRDGFKCEFHPDEQAARAALLADNLSIGV